ncbi:hypothetical protein AB1Y20_001293 [Prymnesium parvum]|uniref:Uncharacterized protein n=1 Tax=Prymnesium parvum TaxID=97485 RepID=A0AB34KC49_PRYPA|mmetsp:Transcript_30104/g.45473  ORF Transcript_30104/g.45473 Transcript_30104/m.45473 type:complete len:193 (+) Transcript_30104:44-622(+)
MLYSAIAFLGLLASANALTIGTAAARHTCVQPRMLERLPGEGDPFDDGKGPRKPIEGPRTDMGISRWHVDAGYIDEEDEPWHATSRPRTSTVTKGALEKSFTSALPFVQPESALMEELRNVESVDAINKAVEACLAAGGRKGCPAIVTAEKMIEAAKKDGKVTKAPPAKDPAQGKGWDDASRTLATVHDNSV